MIAVVAVLLVVGGPVLALVLRVLHRRGAALEAAEWAPAQPPDWRAQRGLHIDQAIDWERVAAAQRREGMTYAAATSDRFAEYHRGRARDR